MNDGEKIKPQLVRVGYFISPIGGAVVPSEILPGEYLFELVTRGRVKHPEKEAWAGPGWIFFHQPGQETIYQSTADEHYECMTALFTIPAPVTDWPRSFRWEETRDAESFSREMLYAFHHEGISLDVLGDLIWAQFSFRYAQDQVRHSHTRIPPRIASVIAEIARHPERAHSVESLAEKVGLSPSHLHAEFKAATGKTPHQMVIQYRMSAARHRLVTSMDPVKAISYDVGFSNTENFCRAFKKHTGLTAAAFRKKYMLYG
ncbi:AraC family transcriptional regulator [Kiritimatiellaeota bacterium B1221]|nr:AraC family transcriptional regulator [Kiritimatiellaeota bacterium B1221]